MRMSQKPVATQVAMEGGEMSADVWDSSVGTRRWNLELKKGILQNAV